MALTIQLARHGQSEANVGDVVSKDVEITRSA